MDKPFCRLLRFKRFTDDLQALSAMKEQPTVLVVAPLSGHHSTLLRDTVRALLRDHKVFITDWTDARMVPLDAGPFHLDDYVTYVQEFIRHIGPEVNVISVCQPTVPVLAAISLMASNGELTPRTMTMMGGPIDARKSPTAVNNLAMNKSHNWFEHNVIYRVPVNYPGAGRAVYPGFLQHSGFVAMNPDRHLSSHYDYFLDLMRGDDDSADSHREFYDEYNAVLDMPAEYYLDTIKTVFQDFALVNGTWHVNGQLVRPQDITTTRAADDRRRARRHLRRRPDARRARPVHRHPEGPPVPLRRRGRRPLRHLLRPPLAREGLPGGARLHRLAPGRRPATAACRARKRARRAPDNSRGARQLNDLASPDRRRAAADAVHALRLPRLRRLRARRGRRARPASTSARRAARRRRAPGCPHRPAGRCRSNPSNGAEGPLRLAVIDEAWCIGCTLCIKACPVDCIVGAPKVMHTVIESPVHRLRTVHSGLPGRLHRAGRTSGGRTGWSAWSDDPGRRGAGTLRLPQGPPRAQAARDNDARLAAKAQAKLADLPQHTRHTDPAVIERKRAVIEAALARARARLKSEE